MHRDLSANVEDTAVAEEVVGHLGRVLGSKSGYRDAHPSNAPIFNSYLYTDDGPIWSGDLDLTIDEDKLRELARRLGKRVYVQYEQFARYGPTFVETLPYAACAVTPDGEVTLYSSWPRVIYRDRDGRLRSRHYSEPATEESVCPT